MAFIILMGLALLVVLLETAIAYLDWRREPYNVNIWWRYDLVLSVYSLYILSVLHRQTGGGF